MYNINRCMYSDFFGPHELQLGVIVPVAFTNASHIRICVYTHAHITYIHVLGRHWAGLKSIDSIHQCIIYTYICLHIYTHNTYMYLAGIGRA